ncbi:MAG TPA: hypothetical protein VFJ16_16085 [Longimicrobium sp.]|nr:hypothetical protein [Longimicrobium sp.]
MARSLVRFALTAAAVTLAACGGAKEIATLPGGTTLEITTDRSAYAAGTNVGLTVRNVGEQTVEYDMCRREFQRLSGSGWATVYVEIPPCLQTFAALRLAPGEVISGAATLPAGLQAGRYRIYFPGFALAEPGTSSADMQTQKSSRPFDVTR